MNLIVSKYFPGTDTPTNFVEKIRSGKKIHTIRTNYDYWNKHDGKEVYICTWTDKPYRSKIKKHFIKKIGVEKLEFTSNYLSSVHIKTPSLFPFHTRLNIKMLSEHDGLKIDQFIKWFENYDLSKPMAIIHFTDYRYSKG